MITYPDHLPLHECTHRGTLWDTYLAIAKVIPQERIPMSSGVTLAHLRSIMTSQDISRRIQWMTFAHNRKASHMLTRAFPSCPGHPGRYEVKVQRDDGAFHFTIFYSVYPARKFLDIVIGDRKTSWINRTTIRCHDLTISSKHMERYMTYEYTDEERNWLLPMPYSYFARSIAFNETHTGEIEPATGQSGIASTGRMSKRAKRLQARAMRSEQRVSTQSPANTGTDAPGTTTGKPKPVQPKRAQDFNYGIPELAKATGLDPSKVRAILRKKVPKPVKGWVWDEAGYNQVLKIIK